jgi:hypothetical protein
MSDRYYVYVYIDPRNLEEFYYGKGKGSRSQAHLQDTGDSVKVARIKAIQQEGLEPIIRIIARGLTSAEALMVETTLIWKLGRTLTNVASGQYVEKFRPPDTFHKRLARFDFENGIYYVNVGEGETRNWDDCLRFGFLAAGGKPKWSDPLRGLEEGDVVVAYLKGAGYVGVGLVRSPAVLKRSVSTTLSNPTLHTTLTTTRTCEYVVRRRVGASSREGRGQVGSEEWPLHDHAYPGIARCPTDHHCVHRRRLWSRSGISGRRRCHLSAASSTEAHLASYRRDCGHVLAASLPAGEGLD